MRTFRLLTLWLCTSISVISGRRHASALGRQPGRAREGTLFIVDVEGMGQSTAPEDSNMLVVIPKKKIKQAPKHVQSVKKLSKKEKKRLNDIIQRKAKKERRAELLESLAKHQATEEEMRHFTSITEVHSQNFKSDPSAMDTFVMKANTVKGSKKKKKLLTQKPERDKESESTDTDDISTDEEMEACVEEEVPAQGDTEVGLSEKEELVSDKIVENSVETAAQTMESVQSLPTASLVPGKKVQSKPATFVPVNRVPEIQEARLKLPILAEEQVVMETISENPVVIICGETGSGKTTQVPQFLYEAGYALGKGMIGVTEPRRVAAISMSRRVATEMNLSPSQVSYQIRFEGNVTQETKIKFLTDGVLLKEAQQDPLLSRYSVIIIDEAHERSVYTDILVGLLSIVVRQREKRGHPLKLVIMSATLRVEDFTGPTLFRREQPPPVIKVEARQYPVTVHFNKKTVDDYVTESYRKVRKIHKTLPEGGILVFVTGQQEVHTLVKKLRQNFPYVQGQAIPERGKKESRRERKKKTDQENEEASELQSLPVVNLDSYSILPQDDEEAERQEEENVDDFPEDDIEEGDDADDETMGVVLEDAPDSTSPLYVLPLYSLLPSHKQALVFEPPPEGCRLCVVATNVAETSLTIPNVRYVVDTGKTKTKFYDKVTGVSTFRVTWVSQASADQRAGRAGRMGPGHCYRLYSSAVFNDFHKFSPPEISRRPVEDLVLQMKSMRIDKVANFPFPTAPDAEQIKTAEDLLVNLGALRRLNQSNRYKALKKAKSPIITELGSNMASFPVSPRYAKMLILSHSYGVLPYMIALVSALSVQEVFENSGQPPDPDGDKEELRKNTQRLSIFKSKLVGNSLLLGDMMLLLTVVGACEVEGCTPSFCHQLGVRVKAMREIRKLRLHLTNTANLVYPSSGLVVDPKLPPPSDAQMLALRKVVLGGLADHVARLTPAPPPDMEKSEAKRLRGSYQCTQLEDLAYIHPESALYGNSQAEFVVYQSMVETSRLYMRGLCCVEPHWLPEMAPSYCILSKPLEDPTPHFDQSSGKVRCHRSGSFSRCNWEFPAVEMEYPDSVECYRWFAKFLMDGDVFPSLKQFTGSLVLPPSTMVKSWAKLQPKTDSMLKALLSHQTSSRDSLKKVWQDNPKFLQKEYLEWVAESKHLEVMEQWPPLR